MIIILWIPLRMQQGDSEATPFNLGAIALFCLMPLSPKVNLYKIDSEPLLLLFVISAAASCAGLLALTASATQIGFAYINSSFVGKFGISQTKFFN